MGFSPASASLIACNKSRFFNKRILALGNPFGAAKFFKKYLTKNQHRYLSALAREEQARALFVEIFGAISFEILDISADEGADHILDLNRTIPHTSLYTSFQVILDFGTQEHVFDNTQFLENIFSLLSVDGLYLFDLPANNYLEHGFRQYSPTFFYDFCAQNRSYLTLNYLAIWSSGICLDTLPLYRKLDSFSDQTIDSNFFSFPNNLLHASQLTGTCISLFNRISSPTCVMGAIRLSDPTKSLQLDFASAQCLYRNFSLHQVLPDSTPTKKRSYSLRSNLVKISKSSVHYLPPKLAIYLLLFLLTPINFIRKTFFLSE